jgi:ketosteroid isomerase-like protein
MLKRLTLLTFIVLCPAVQSQIKSPEAEIRTARQASNAALRSHDLKAFADSLDTDFVMIRGNGVLVPSRRAYIDTFRKDFADPKAVRYERIPDNVQISNAAPLAAEHGHWVGTRPDGSAAYGGTYLAMWRGTASGWKLRSELFVVLTCADSASCAGYRKP